MSNSSQDSVSQNKDYTLDVFYQYLRSWKWFAGIIFLALLLAFIYIKVKAPVYSLNASVLIKKEDQKASSMMASAMMKNFGVGMGGLIASGNTDDEIQVFLSQNIFRKTVASLGLNINYQLEKFPLNKPLYKNSPVLLEINPSIVDTLSSSFLLKVEAEKDGLRVKVKNGKKDIGTYEFNDFPAVIKTKVGTFRLVRNDSIHVLLPYAVEITLGGLDAVAEDLKENVSVGTLTKKSDVIGLNVDDEIRQRGMDILNEIIRQYNIDALSDKNKTSLNTTQFLKIRIDSLYSELRVIENNIESYKTANKFIDAGTEVSLTLSKIAELQSKNSSFDIQLAMINAIESQIKTKGKEFQLLPSSVGLPGNVATAVDKFNDAILYRMRILRNSNEANPAVQAIDEQLKTVNKNLLASLQNAKNDIGISKADAKMIESQINQRVGDMPRLERDYVDLRRQQELKSQIYLFLLQKMEETQLTLASTEAKARIVDQAYALAKPVAPRKLIILLAALVGGFFVAAIVVCIRILRNPKVSSFRELQTLAECGVSGPLVLEGDALLALRGLRSNILDKLHLDSGGQVVVFSSIEPEQGKADLALKLSENFAKAGFKTLLVDLDFIDFALTHRLNLASVKGISDYILKSASVEDVVKKSSIHPGLELVSAGNGTEAIEMLTYKSLYPLFGQLREEYEIIVVNTAAFAQLPDSLAVARLADCNLFVVNLGESSKKGVTHLNTLIRGNKIENVCLLAL